jgi:hypothetical protein
LGLGQMSVQTAIRKLTLNLPQSRNFGNFVELAENAVFREPYSMEWIKSREPLQD